MEEQIVSFETAKLAKEKGFGLSDEHYIHLHTFYNTITKELTIEPHTFKRDTSKTPHGSLQLNLVEVGVSQGMDNSTDEYTLAPTQAFLQKWLREEHDTHIAPYPYFETASDYEITGHFVGDIYTTSGSTIYYGDDNYATYEEALEKGLQEALKLIGERDG